MFPKFYRYLLKYTRIERCGCRWFSSQQQVRKQPGRGSLFLDARNLLLVCPVTCVFLAYWQIKRKKWKEDLIATIKDRYEMEPLELPNDLEEIKKLNLYPVKVRGHFDYANEVYIGPRQDSPEVLQTHYIPGNRSPGVHVVTPFKLADRDMTILVNRGWYQDIIFASEENRRKGQVHGEQEIVGIIRDDQDTSARFWKFLFDFERPEKKAGCDVYYVRKVGVMAERCGTAPVFLDAKMVRKSPHEPKPIELGVELRNQHAAYIVTWSSLAVITTYLWATKFRSPMKPSTVNAFISRQEANRNVKR
ncbi:surfeit locus protein 1-like [Mercenaria mercenaria]|uniref:surfeit locus protein 1-like n=1 Tax=Mercenaria mercenaria TaxID=6596 RepID=UPI00234F53EC|nr:surfeit locus protein 1-like [Mercenaria mercenaria]